MLWFAPIGSIPNEFIDFIENQTEEGIPQMTDLPNGTDTITAVEPVAPVAPPSAAPEPVAPTPVAPVAPAPVAGMDAALRSRLASEFGLGDDAIMALERAGVKTEADLSTLTATELKELGVPLVPVKRIVQAFTATATPASPAVGVASGSFDILPQVPDDKSWLEMLQAGGVLTAVTPAAAVGAVRAALADKVGLFGLPIKLATAIERHAEAAGVPVGPEFFELNDFATRHRYGNIFAALGARGNFATKERKIALLRRLEEHLWPALVSFQNQVKSWVDTWLQTSANPAIMISAFASMAAGGGVLPPGMIEVPSVDPLRDAAASIIDVINKVFAGVGAPVAMALAYDATQIRTVMERSNLPTLVGAANRDQMLRLLGADVAPDYPRLEKSMVRYVLSVLEFPNIAAGQDELRFVSALHQLGNMIPWDKLPGSTAQLSSVAVGRKASEKGGVFPNDGRRNIFGEDDDR